MSVSQDLMANAAGAAGLSPSQLQQMLGLFNRMASMTAGTIRFHRHGNALSIDISEDRPVAAGDPYLPDNAKNARRRNMKTGKTCNIRPGPGGRRDCGAYGDPRGPLDL